MILVFVRLELNGGQIRAVEVQRITTGWKCIAEYATTVGEHVRLDAAMRTIGTMLVRSDRMIFATQQERDIFLHVAKCWLDVRILAQSRIMTGLISQQPTNLRRMLMEISNTGLSLQQFAAMVAER